MGITITISILLLTTKKKIFALTKRNTCIGATTISR